MLKDNKAVTQVRLEPATPRSRVEGNLKNDFQLKMYKNGDQNFQFFTGFHFLAFRSKHLMENETFSRKNIRVIAR